MIRLTVTAILCVTIFCIRFPDILTAVNPFSPSSWTVASLNRRSAVALKSRGVATMPRRARCHWGWNHKQHEWNRRFPAVNSGVTLTFRTTGFNRNMPLYLSPLGPTASWLTDSINSEDPTASLNFFKRYGVAFQRQSVSGPFFVIFISSPFSPQNRAAMSQRVENGSRSIACSHPARPFLSEAQNFTVPPSLGFLPEPSATAPFALFCFFFVDISMIMSYYFKNKR